MAASKRRCIRLVRVGRRSMVHTERYHMMGMGMEKEGMVTRRMGVMIMGLVWLMGRVGANPGPKPIKPTKPTKPIRTQSCVLYSLTVPGHNG